MLPDLLKVNLDIVFCGTAAGKKSAELQEYYAGSGNKFWRILYQVGLTERQLNPVEYRELFWARIGLTDLVKGKSGMDITLKSSDFGNNEFLEKIKKYKPRILCFNGKKAAKEFLKRDVEYGTQSDKIAETIIFVAPSTSGAANGFWDKAYWEELAKLV